MDPDLHLACYRIQSDMSTTYQAVVVDQFGSYDVVLENNTYLCVPAEKGPWVGSEPSTWGRIKALYH